MYTLEALASECDVSLRQVRRWIRQGAVSPGTGRMRSGNFTHEHVRQVLAIKRALDNQVTLADLAERRRWKDHPEE